jgi:hypothetical protein
MRTVISPSVVDTGLKICVALWCIRSEELIVCTLSRIVCPAQVVVLCCVALRLFKFFKFNFFLKVERSKVDNS